MWLQSTGDPIIKLVTSPKSAIPVRSKGQDHQQKPA